MNSISDLVLFLAIGLCIVGGVFALGRWPSFPIHILYPLTWIFGGYTFPVLGGRFERISALLGLFGLILVAQRQRLRISSVPRLMVIGIILLLGSYFLSWILNRDVPDSGESVLSLISRIVFLFLVVFHVRSEKDIRLTIWSLVASSVIACFVTLWLEMTFGFGFNRVDASMRAVRLSVDPMLVILSSNTNQVTAAGMLLLGMYGWVEKRRTKIFLLAVVFFFFLMAFASQFRREILVTIPILLAYLYFDKRSGVSKLALPILIGSVVLFLGFILPNSPIMQQRLQEETAMVLEKRESRMMSFSYGLSVFIDSPFIGRGPGSYGSTMYKILEYGDASYSANPYNVFIWIAVEAGMLGLFGMIMILVATFKAAYDNRITGPPYANLVVRMGPVLVMLIVIWFSFGNAATLSLPWFLVGLIVASARVARCDHSQVTQKANLHHHLPPGRRFVPSVPQSWRV